MKEKERIFEAILIIAVVLFFTSFVVLQVMSKKISETKTEKAKQEIALAKTVTEVKEIKEIKEVKEEEVEEVEVEAKAKAKEYFKDICNNGDTYGIISYLNVESAIVVGADEKNLENVAMLHSFSDNDNMVVLGHSYKNGTVFGTLWALQPSDSITITATNGDIKEFEVISTEWQSEEYYNSDEGRKNLFDRADDLKLATCQTKNGTQGRLIIHCSIK